MIQPSAEWDIQIHTQVMLSWVVKIKFVMGKKYNTIYGCNNLLLMQFKQKL